MSSAFEELFSIANAFHGIPMAGRTDAWILSDAAAAHGIPADSADLARFRERLRASLSPIELEKPGVARKGADAGRPRAARRARRRATDVYLALLTGNYEAGARLKLEYFDLWRYFPCGAFGDDAPHRNVLVPKALARVAACGGPSFAAQTPSSSATRRSTSACAAHGGARSLAVATGSHSVDELRAAGADAVLEDLERHRDG